MTENNIWEKYEKKEILGTGAFSNVYKGINKTTGDYVAIKEIDKNKYKSANNINESEIMVKIKNKNSVNLKEVFDTKQYFYIIMELCIYSLDEYLKMKKNLSIDEIKYILNQLNNTFKLLSKENIIHRDLKLSNILLSLDQINKTTIKLSDYGISKIFDDDITNTKNGTPLTMAPEVIKGEFVSIKCDIWSLGIIIYFMYFGEYPYNGNSEYQIIKNMESKKLKEINDIELNDLVNKMLMQDEKKRISWNDYFNHPFFKENDSKENLEKIEESDKDKIELNQNILPHFQMICKKHLKHINFYCINCKSNICELCLNEHKSHKFISFLDIGLTEKEKNQFEKLIKEFNINFNTFSKLKNNIVTLINKMKLNKENSNIYENDSNNNYKQYYIDFFEFVNKKLKSYENLNLIQLNDFENLIYCEHLIQKKDENDELNRQILNCYEKIIKEFPNLEGKKNKIELKENCELYINDEKIDFYFNYQFPQEGSNIIKIICQKPLINTNYMFCNCSTLTLLDLSNFKTNNIINMNCMFYNCSSLISLNLSNVNTINVTDMSWMFCNCSSLNILNLSNFNTINVKNMNSMFYNCSSLKILDLSNFNTDNVLDMSWMFKNCSSLKTLNLSNFNTENVIDMNDMFYECSNLISLNLSNFNNVINVNGMFYNLNPNCIIITNNEKLLNKNDEKYANCFIY